MTSWGCFQMRHFRHPNLFFRPKKFTIKNIKCRKFYALQINGELGTYIIKQNKSENFELNLRTRDYWHSRYCYFYYYYCYWRFLKFSSKTKTNDRCMNKSLLSRVWSAHKCHWRATSKIFQIKCQWARELSIIIFEMSLIIN